MAKAGKKTLKTTPIEHLLKTKSGIRLDVGCGGNKQGASWVGIDYRALPGVDIVHDLSVIPWPLPSASVQVAVSSHVIENIEPTSLPSQLINLVKLLNDKGIISSKEIKEYIGELFLTPRFIAFMDEMWRILQPDGEFAIVCPYGGSPGFWQDPSHINGVNETTFSYFDPLDTRTGGQLYNIYKPKPWKIKENSLSLSKNGNIEVVLIKRREDPSYGSNNH